MYFNCRGKAPHLLKPSKTDFKIENMSPNCCIEKGIQLYCIPQRVREIVRFSKFKNTVSGFSLKIFDKNTGILH